MRSLSVRLLLSFLTLFLVPAAFAHDVTLTGTNSFASLDGSSSDHDGAVNGVFTVNDGNLIVNGVVNCNDDGAGGNSACPMAFVVSGNLTVNVGGALYAENRNGSGSGAAISLTVGGDLTLSGNAIVSGASTSNSGNSNGGAISATVSGNVSLGAGSTIDAGSPGGTAGNIAIAAGGVVTVDGNVLSGPSRTLAATRLTGVVLTGASGGQRGGQISLSSTSFAEPAVVVGATANVVAQGEVSTGSVTLDGCGVEVRGLVAAVSRDSAAAVTIRSGKSVVVDGRDLGAAGTRMGRVRADSTTGTASSKRVDVYAADSVSIDGPAAGLFAVTSNTGSNDPKGEGGSVRVIALGGTASASSNAIAAGGANTGNGGGSISIASAGDAALNGATLRAAGDHTSSNSNRDGGAINVRSYSGDVLWTNGTGDVRPVGSASGIALADQGSIVLTACGTVDTTGSSFPVNGVATSVHPQTQTGVCSPAAASLPAGVAPLITCNTPPVANDASATTNEDTAVTITLSGSDADGDPLTFSIVSGPSNGALGPIVPTGPTTATVNYTPNLNYFGGDSFVYQANDGNGGTDNATVTITVAPVNDAPSFLAGPTVTVLEDSGPQTYPGWASSISAGPANESGQTVTFTVTTDNPSLFSVQPAVAPNGTLTFTPAANAHGTANISVTAHDDGGSANGGVDTSAPQGSSITVTGVNDAPSFTAGGDVTVNEDSGAYSAPWASAISAGPNETQNLTFFASNDDNALFSVQPAISPSGLLTFTPAANANGSATVTIYLQDDGGTANGGVDTSASVQFTIYVNSVNDEPSFTSGGDASVLEDSGAYSAAWATAISAGSGETQNVTFFASNDNNGLFSVQPAISSTGVLTFTVAPDAFGSALITVYLQDDGGTANGGDDTSSSVQFTIHVTGVNDAPSFTSGGEVTVNEDSGAYSAAWATGISAGPGEGAQTVAFSTSNDNNGLFSVQPSISATGVLSFTPAPNANGFAMVTVTLSDNGGTANGGVDTSASVTFKITVNAVNDPPVAGNDAWETEGNTELRVDVGATATPHVLDTTPSGTGVLHNDSDPVDGDAIAITGVVGCADVTAPYDCAVTGGTVSLNANGTFSFQPAPGATAGSFQYTVSDGAATANATVAITNHDMIWYVNGSVPAGGNGTSSSPFNDFTSLNGLGDVDGGGDYIFVHSSTVNDSIALEAAQKLWGQGIGLIIPRNLNGNGSPATLVAPGSRPHLNATGNAVKVIGVTGIHVAGLNLSSSTGNGIEVTSPLFGGATSATIYSNEVLVAVQEGIDINAFGPGGLTVSIDGTSVTSNGNGVDVLGAAGTVVFAYSNGTITSVGGNGLVIDGTTADTLIVNGLSNVTISGNTAGNGISITAAHFDANAGTPAYDAVAAGAMNVGASGNPVGGAAVTMSNVSGNLAFGSFSAHGSTTGITIAGSGLFTGVAGMQVTSGGGAVSAAAGAGLTLTNTSIGAANLAFTSISATGGANGIVLNNTGTAGSLKVLGTGTAGSGGTILNTTGDGISLTNTFNPSFASVNVTGSGADGIDATTVTGLTLTECVLTNSGNAANEHGLKLTNVGGTVTINGSTFNNAAHDLVHLQNTDVNATLDVGGSSSFSFPATVAPSANTAISIMPNGSSAITVSITGSTFTDIPGNAARFGATAAATGTSSFTFSSNTVNALLAGRASSVTVSGQGATTTSIAVTANNFTGAGGNGVIGVDANDSSLVKGTIGSNAITNAGGTGIFAASDEGATARLVIDGNTITNSGSDGILAVNFGGLGISATEVVITNNLVDGSNVNPSAAFIAGIVFFGFEDNACVAMTGNNVINTPSSPTACGGAPCADYYVEESGGTTVWEEVPNTAATTLTPAYIQSTNSPATASVTVFGTIDLSNGASCTRP